MHVYAANNPVDAVDYTGLTPTPVYTDNPTGALPPGWWTWDDGGGVNGYSNYGKPSPPKRRQMPRPKPAPKTKPTPKPIGMKILPPENRFPEVRFPGYAGFLIEGIEPMNPNEPCKPESFSEKQDAIDFYELDVSAALVGVSLTYVPGVGVFLTPGIQIGSPGVSFSPGTTSGLSKTEVKEVLSGKAVEGTLILPPGVGGSAGVADKGGTFAPVFGWPPGGNVRGKWGFHIW